jgi:hypothetical protein
MTLADSSLAKGFLSAPAKGMHKTDKLSIIEDMINFFI